MSSLTNKSLLTLLILISILKPMPLLHSQASLNVYINPSEGPPGTVVYVKGDITYENGVDVSQYVDIYFNGINMTRCEIEYEDSIGYFECNFTVPETAYGFYNIIVIVSETIIHTTTFKVTPKISLSKNIVFSDDRSITVYLRGFPSSKMVDIFVNDMWLTKTITNINGSRNVSIYIPYDLPRGEHFIKAVFEHEGSVIEVQSEPFKYIQVEKIEIHTSGGNIYFLGETASLSILTLIDGIPCNASLTVALLRPDNIIENVANISGQSGFYIVSIYLDPSQYINGTYHVLIYAEYSDEHSYIYARGYTTFSFQISSTFSYILGKIVEIRDDVVVILTQIGYLSLSLNDLNLRIIKIAESTSELNKSITEYYLVINTSMTNILIKLNEINTSIINLHSLFNGLNVTVNTLFNKTFNEIKKLYQNITMYYLDINNTLAFHNKDVKEFINNLYNTLYSTIVEVNTSLGKVNTTLYHLGIEIKDLLILTNRSIIARIDTCLNELVVKLDNAVSDIKIEIKNAVKDVKSELTNVKGEIISIINNVSNDITNLLRDIEMLLREVNESIVLTIDVKSENVTKELKMHIETMFGNLTMYLNESHYNITNLIVTSRNEILATIDTLNYTIIARIDELDAKITKLIEDAEKNIIVEIKTSLGILLIRLENLNLTLQSLISNLNVSLIRSLNELNSTISYRFNVIEASIDDLKRSVILKLDSIIGELRVRLSELNVSISQLIVTSKNEIIGVLNSKIGELYLNMSEINVSLTNIIMNTKKDIIWKIETSTGTIIANLTNIHNELTELIRRLGVNITIMVVDTNRTLYYTLNSLFNTVFNKLDDILNNIDKTMNLIIIKSNETFSLLKVINTTIVNEISVSKIVVSNLIRNVNLTLSSTVVDNANKILLNISRTSIYLESIILTKTGEILGELRIFNSTLYVLLSHINSTIHYDVFKRLDNILDVIADEGDNIVAKINLSNLTINTKLDSVLNSLKNTNATLATLLNTKTGDLYLLIKHANSTILAQLLDLRRNTTLKIDTVYELLMTKLNSTESSIINKIENVNLTLLQNIEAERQDLKNFIKERTEESTNILRNYATLSNALSIILLLLVGLVVLLIRRG